MDSKEILAALGRYSKETAATERQIATKVGIKRLTLRACLSGQHKPDKYLLARLAGFLKRSGYI